MYQKILAIGDALTLEPEILKMLQTDKALAIKKSKKIDSLFLYSERIRKWKKHYVILSGAYIYAYETNKQLYPSFYFYISNGILKDEGLNQQEKLLILNVYNLIILIYR